MNAQPAIIEAPAFDASVFRAAMGTFATGVAVAMATHDDRLHGMTVNSLTSPHKSFDKIKGELYLSFR
jgi:flavin reductase (DIM6/NTAB) family NADH-FMN oxidoreductase RutF